MGYTQSVYAHTFLVLPACEESHKQVRVEPDDTFNVSTRSVDYDGDSEDCGDAMDSSSDEGSFCVGRSCYASYLSMDEFSDNDDETQTKTGQISFNDFGLDKVNSYIYSITLLSTNR